MKFFIIHGVYGSPKENWFPWLKKELENQGYEAVVPKFPTPIDQSLESWLRTIKKYEDKINKETVMIGHSLGAAFILNYLEQTERKIKSAVLVAGFFQLLNSPYDAINKTFVDKDFNWKKIKENCGKFFVVASDNDDFISMEISRQLSLNLNAKLNIINKGGHLNAKAGYKEFPFLIDLVKTI